MIKTLLVVLAVAFAQPQADLSGPWAFAVVDLGVTNTSRMVLTQSGETLSGRIGNQPVEGTFRGGAISIKSADRSATGTFAAGQLTGELSQGGRTLKWTATRIPPRPVQPRTHTFEPTTFELYFTSRVAPVLRIAAGDTVRTWSVDAGGVDAKGERRSGPGNPQTGPFFIEGAMPGDTLVVRLNRIRTNRNWARSGSEVMANALDPYHHANLKWTEPFNSRWTIDAAAGIVRLEQPPDNLKDFTVPLRPMLGCIGVAPGQQLAVRTTDSWRFGGNMDYNQLVEGTTVYLPVNHPGALLFVGDGHAAQGDGELTGDALETSMDIEFTVDVLEQPNYGQPRAENDDYLISIGVGGSLDQALQMATSGMMRWLERDYKLSATESAIVLGFAIKYDVVDLVGTQVSIAAKLPKTALSKLRKAS